MEHEVLGSCVGTPMTACAYCSNGLSQVFHTGSCPEVKSVEYYPDGTIKRVYFKEG